MDASTKLQVDIIMKNFSKMKASYLKVKSANEHLEEAVKLLRGRLEQKEQRIYDLIVLFKKISGENREKMQSIEKENSLHQITIQEQIKTIQEYSDTIDKLKGEINLLKLANRVDQDSFETQSCFNKQIKQNTANKNCINQLSKKDNGFNGNISFAHPCFESEAKVTKKGLKKLQTHSQFRWANLDITIGNGDDLTKNVTNVDSASDKDDNISKLEKRRKLYRPDDDSTVDLMSVEGD